VNDRRIMAAVDASFVEARMVVAGERCPGCGLVHPTSSYACEPAPALTVADLDGARLILSDGTERVVRVWTAS
jgi:hypothetical protein